MRGTCRKSEFEREQNNSRTACVVASLSHVRCGGGSQFLVANETRRKMS